MEQFISTKLHWTMDKVEIKKKKKFVVSLPPFTVQKEIYGGVILSIAVAFFFFFHSFSFFILIYFLFQNCMLCVVFVKYTFMLFYTVCEHVFHAMPPLLLLLFVVFYVASLALATTTWYICLMYAFLFWTGSSGMDSQHTTNISLNLMEWKRNVKYFQCKIIMRRLFIVFDSSMIWSPPSH